MAISELIMEDLKIGFLLIDIRFDPFIALAMVATEVVECSATVKLLPHPILLLTLSCPQGALHHRCLFCVSNSSWVVDAKQPVNVRVGDVWSDTIFVPVLDYYAVMSVLPGLGVYMPMVRTLFIPIGETSERRNHHMPASQSKGLPLIGGWSFEIQEAPQSATTFMVSR